MTVRGIPDCSRAARIVLKDYVNGKLCYCHPPPNVRPKEFQPDSYILDEAQMDSPHVPADPSSERERV
jgi:ribosome biogenesis GTPase A